MLGGDHRLVQSVCSLLPGIEHAGCVVLSGGACACRPEIFSSDRGSQFTSLEFTGRLYDNIFVEHLWRAVKYEEVCLKDYVDISEAIEGIRATSISTTTSDRTKRSATSTPAEVHFTRGEKFTLE